MYFDAVLNDSMVPLFNGTPEETKKWLEKNATSEAVQVCIGKTMQIVSISEYLKK